MKIRDVAFAADWNKSDNKINKKTKSELKINYKLNRNTPPPPPPPPRKKKFCKSVSCHEVRVKFKELKQKYQCCLGN